MALVLRGEVDVSTPALLEEALDSDAVREAIRVTLDLANCAFADSVGLAVVIRTALGLRERGGELILRFPTDQLRRLFQVTRALEPPQCGGRVLLAGSGRSGAHRAQTRWLRS
jgi:anti-anti-sigma factor